ncbi:pseudouridine synthase [Chloroflexota bacterium]
MEKVTESLLRVLIEAGVGSRRRSADTIKQGRVAVNGKVVEDFRYAVNRGIDHISVDGQLLELKPEKLIYLMLHKPRGVLSTVSDERGRKTVLSILPAKYRHLRLYPAGRLDRDSSGLLLLTNDGEFTYRLTHPRFEHEKEYLIHIDGNLRPGEKRMLEQGIKLEDGVTYPAVVKEVKSSPPFNYSLTMHEGRKRQVRRMFAALGFRVLTLTRVRIGNLSLGNLKEGAVRQLSSREVRGLSGDPPAG